MPACFTAPPQLVDMLRRLSRQLNDERDSIKLERRTSKRERISRFFRSRKQKPKQYDEAPTSPSPDRTLSLQPSRFKNAGTTTSEPSSSSIDALRTSSLKEVRRETMTSTILGEDQQTDDKSVGITPLERSFDTTTLSAPTDQINAPHLHSRLAAEEHKDEIDLLSGASTQALFSGAPSFSVEFMAGRALPKVSYPWDSEVEHDDADDSIHPVEPSFMAATVHVHPSKKHSTFGVENRHQIYQVNAVEVPSWLSAQGFEPGSIGFAHFVELPQADNLVTDSLYDDASEEFIETSRNKVLMQTTPERIGIRYVNMDAVYDRLIEFQDLYEAFQHSPERITILNNQSPGDLYAHLFSTFLTPPGYAGANLDPTGLQVQIVAILRVLNLKGIWHDFSLVEWRIRLGQLLFCDPEAMPGRNAQTLWTERDILLLQISLSCELLLRLDAIAATYAGKTDGQTRISAQEIQTFHNLTSRKTDWDLILAHRFLENILVIKGNDNGALTPVPEPRGLFSLLGGTTPKELPRSDVIFLPQHQSRQLSGLLYFAESIKWPNMDSLTKSLAEKLGVVTQDVERTITPSSPSGWSFNPTTPSVVSVYGTPLQTPRSATHQLDDYFGRVQKPIVRRNDSRSLRVPLSTTLVTLQDSPSPTMVDIGGWLSRSFLTGMILPGEAISHFLISTLLENDQLAISALGDSANLYGGFIYDGKTWWSKASVVGRVLACTEGAQECMGWIYVSKLPEGASVGWHSIHSEQLPVASRINVDRDLVAADASAVPAGPDVPVRSKDLVMPKDLEFSPGTAARFLQWDLTPLNLDLIDVDTNLGPPTESDINTPSLTFMIEKTDEECVLTLAYEVQFVASWPCYTPASTSAASPRHVVKSSKSGTLSHTSSKRSVSTKLSRSNSHGFEPLLSHPPEAAGIGPQRSHTTEWDEVQSESTALVRPLIAHPLHVSYTHVIVPVTDVLKPKFTLPFTMSANRLPMCSSSILPRDMHEDRSGVNDRRAVLVLDARGTADLQLLARAWCAEKGLHAVIGRVERTCLACCIREARGLGINVVIRV
ncbi:uncharacterized protein EKO05_0006338 [Ascochyta rabiei]|uniref:Uncharacterized protein n=1 Tax=Didymella rabiei TaxID=5454 RepID=A0A163A178_DIDRA|nr:uncharacterized protein EKO05_0006338 [Ascochyta rabiei]KZM20925.1 hypothetical protein ST47_g7953 [Ascochyta rabiei]UPX15906.1 hypothetical protein EKO05_0006338 [Ascochyta rabiei]